MCRMCTMLYVAGCQVEVFFQSMQCGFILLQIFPQIIFDKEMWAIGAVCCRWEAKLIPFMPVCVLWCAVVVIVCMV